MAHWMLDTAGIGSIIVAIVAGAVFLAYAAMVRWIATAPRDEK
jgi:hypothetical protein